MIDESFAPYALADAVLKAMREPSKTARAGFLAAAQFYALTIRTATIRQAQRRRSPR